MNSTECRLDEFPFIVLTDIHADPAALRAVMRAAYDSSTVKYRCFLGDAIGYGHDPTSVLESLKDFDVAIKGNHEMLALNQVNPEWYSPNARKSILAHANGLTPAQHDFIAAFADKFVSGKIALFHGNPESALEYIFSANDANNVFIHHPEYDLMFGGHTHIPRLVSCDKNSGEIDYHEIRQPYTSYNLDLDRFRYLVTCPSVTPGRFTGALPGCCRLQHQSATQKTLEFIFTILGNN